MLAPSLNPILLKLREQLRNPDGTARLTRREIVWLAVWAMTRGDLSPWHFGMEEVGDDFPCAAAVSIHLSRGPEGGRQSIAWLDEADFASPEVFQKWVTRVVLERFSGLHGHIDRHDEPEWRSFGNRRQQLPRRAAASAARRPRWGRNVHGLRVEEYDRSIVERAIVFRNHDPVLLCISYNPERGPT